MPTIPCPGQERLTEEFTESSTGVRGTATSNAARKSAADRVLQHQSWLDANVECASGCELVWKIFESDAYVYECKRYWFTIWIAVRCWAKGKLDVRATCTKYNFEEELRRARSSGSSGDS